MEKQNQVYMFKKLKAQSPLATWLYKVLPLIVPAAADV